jgi:lipoate-protein ligase B
MGNICQIQWLDRMEYGDAMKLQQKLVAKRAANEIPNTMLLVEHPHTYTIGIDSHREHLLLNRDELARLDIACHEVGRGGLITYHGPGQLVGYPILNLREYNYSYHNYISMLESVIIHALLPFKVQAFRQPGQRGVWVLPDNLPHISPAWANTDDQIAKIGAVGVKVNEAHITSYGFSINVAPNLDFFDLIVPSGLQGCKVTSLEQVLNSPIEIGSAIGPVIQSFCKLFESEPLEINLPPLPKEVMDNSARELVPH